MNKKRVIQEQNRARSAKRRKVLRSLHDIEGCINDISSDESFEVDNSGDIKNDDELVDDVTNSFNDENSFNIESENNSVDNLNFSNNDNEEEICEEIQDVLINCIIGGNGYESSSADEFSDQEELEERLKNNREHPWNIVPPEIQEIRELVVEKNVPQNVVDPLLKILRQRLLPSLPKSCKTFLNTTDARYNIIDIEDSTGGRGEFVYFGIEKGLRNCINTEIHGENVLYIEIFIDGVPLTKSGHLDFWPILCKVHFDPDIYKVFPVAIYSGKSKPKNLEEYLEDLVAELNELQSNGISINNRQFNVILKCIICDTPARAFVKNTLGHRGFEACERCEVIGHTEERTTVFPSTDSPERTDASFRNRTQPEHHHGPTPLNRVFPHLNMILIFVLDFMHLCCLGVMKKLLEYWLIGNLNVRLSVRQRNELSRRMNVFYSQIPDEFQRKSRSTKFFAKWKAVEFRFFLLYSGPIALKKILRYDLYKHFLLLHTSCRILCSDVLCTKHTEIVKTYLRSFFIALKDYYGPKSQNLNAHHIIHLTDDVESMRCSLSRISAFKFESYLGKLKNLVRTANRPLAQVCRRLFERSNIIDVKPTLPPFFKILQQRGELIKKIRYKEVTISTSAPNNMVLLEDDSVLQVKSIYVSPEGLKIEGQLWGKKKPIFKYPLNSKHLKMWKLKSLPDINLRSYLISYIKHKLVKLSVSMKEGDEVEVYVMPLLH